MKNFFCAASEVAKLMKLSAAPGFFEYVEIPRL